jgi:hypothetical protein
VDREGEPAAKVATEGLRSAQRVRSLDPDGLLGVLAAISPRSAGIVDQIVGENELDSSRFSCCGDEDLFPFAPRDGRCMVFCYECDTLYRNPSDPPELADEVNSFGPGRPILACPGRGFEFEYHFLFNPVYRVTRHEWVAAGLGHLLAAPDPSSEG